MSFGEFLWGMVIFFFWVMYIWMFIAVFGDIFRRDDLSGWLKAGWIFLIFIIPLLGILLYLITRPKMTAQDQAMLEAAQVREQRMSGYSASDEIEKAKKLLDSGAITAEEFDAMKKKAMMTV
jgi:Short C-terminal domain/Phospholipase_D-nuclease N-terminal